MNDGWNMNDRLDAVCQTFVLHGAAPASAQGREIWPRS